MKNNLKKSKLYLQIEEASNRIYQICKKTPLEYSDFLSTYFNSRIFLKREYEQYTGSFKLRGATNKILKISESGFFEKDKISVVTASTGNHGSAVSYACNKINKKNNKNKIETLIFSTCNVDKSKADIIEMYGGKLIKISSNDSLYAEKEAINYVENNQLDGSTIYISPYNDLDVICGQGTIGKEIIDDLADLENIDAIFVSVGGGGLIAGISSYVKSKNPNCKIIACQPENSRVMYESVKAGKIISNLEELETLSDGTAGGVEENTITFPIIQNLIHADDFVLASENEISEALVMLVEKEKIIVEGSAALTLACYAKVRDLWLNKNVVLVLCGKNIGLSKLKKVLK